MSRVRNWREFNKEWRNLEAEKRFDRTLIFLTRIAINPPKKFWWGIFFGSLIGVLLLAPESNFSIRIRDLFYSVQYALIDVLDALIASFKKYPLPSVAMTLIIISFVFNSRHQKIKKDFEKSEIDEIKSKSPAEKYLILINVIRQSSRSSGWLSIILTLLGAIMGSILSTVERG